MRIREVILPPERGRIFDADGRILADNERILTVTVDQEVIRNRPDTREDLFRRLAGPLGYTSWLDWTFDSAGRPRMIDDTVHRRVQPGPSRQDCNGVFDPYLPFPAKDDVAEPMVLFLRERAPRTIPGSMSPTAGSASISYAPLASQIVGYLGAIPEDDKDTPDATSTASISTPATG